MVTLHFRVKNWWEEVSAVEALAFEIREAIDRASVESGLRPDSVRLTLQPAPSLATAADVAEELGSTSEGSGVYLNAGYYAGDRVDAASASSLAREGVYFSILLTETSWPQALSLAEVENAVAEEDPINATRFAINTLGAPIITPYYPLSSTVEAPPHVTVGLTYPNYLAEAYRSSGRQGLAEATHKAGEDALRLARIIASILGVKKVGVDLSVAPWMRETSLGLVEMIAGVRLPEPGIALGIETVNSALREAAERLPSVGFNSVQLPVAEDLKLKARVSEGETTARDLARLAGVCLAGLDMVAVPYEEKLVAGLILEVAAYAKAKKTPLGVRIIPLEGVEPGDRIALGRFGELPVMPP